MDREYRADFVAVYGFDFNAAAKDLGVSRRSIIRWYEKEPNPLAKRLLRIMARGYLPETGIFAEWRIYDGWLYTPWGKFKASDVEYLQQYKWHSRELAARMRNKKKDYEELEARLHAILGEAENVRAIIKRMNGEALP